MLQAKPPFNYFLLSFVLDIQVLINFALLHFGLNPIHHIVRFRPQNIDQGDFIAFLIRSDRIVQAVKVNFDVFSRFSGPLTLGLFLE